MLSRPADELNRTGNYPYPLFFLFVDPCLFIQDRRSLPICQSESNSDLVDHNGIAPAYIGAEISIGQRDSCVRKSDALRVCVQFFGVDEHPVHIEDNGLCSRYRLCPARSFSENFSAVTCLPKIGTHAIRAPRNQNALCKPISLDKKPMAAGPVSMPAYPAVVRAATANPFGIACCVPTSLNKIGTMFAAPRPTKIKLTSAIHATGARRMPHNPRSAITPPSVSTKRFPNRATMPSPTKRLTVIAMEKIMYPSPPCAAETRCSPTSKSALQSSRAPSTKNETAAKMAMTSTTPLGIAKRRCCVLSRFESMRGRATTISATRIMELRIVLELSAMPRERRTATIPDPRNPPTLKSA